MAQVWRVFCAGLLLCGCAHAPANGPGAFSISLQVEAQVHGETTRRMLAPGESLHSQDPYALKLRVDQPLYVYVVRYSATAWSTRMFPLRGDFQLSPGDWLRLPADKKDYQLDDKTGDETLYVIATRAPIEAATCKRVRLLCEKPGATPARADSEDPPPPSPDEKAADQGDPQIDRADQEITAVQKSDKDGVAILRFRFQHVP